MTLLPFSLGGRWPAWLLLLWLPGVAPGCIARYGFPQLASPAAAVGRPSVATAPLAVKLAVPRRQEAFFVSRLEAGERGPVSLVDTVPARGRFVSITVTEVPNSVSAQIWGTLALMTCFILPAYSTTSGYDLSFDTFVDGQPQGSYRYEVRETIVVWVGLLPAIWGNFLTRSRSDAFSDTIDRFVADSRKAGF